MNSASIGFETPGMQNNGRNFFFRVAEAMTLDGLQIDCAMAPLPNITGFAEMFVCGYLLKAAPVFSAGPEGFFSTAQSPDFDSLAHQPQGIDFRGGNVSDGGMFSFILKEWMPKGASNSVYMPLGLTASPGNYILFHRLRNTWHAIDFELQAVLFYE